MNPISPSSPGFYPPYNAIPPRQEKEIFLSKVCGTLVSISLETEDIFSQQTLDDLIKDAKENKRDLVIALIEDQSEIISVYEASAYCRWAALETNQLINPSNRVKVENITFYILTYKSMEDPEVDQADYLCDWGQLQDQENSPCFDRIIALTDPRIEKDKKYTIEMSLAMDILFSRGIQGNKANFFEYVQQKVENNPYCQLAVSWCYRRGFGIFQNNEEAEVWIKKAEEKLKPETMNELCLFLDNSFKTYELKFNNSPSPGKQSFSLV